MISDRGLWILPLVALLEVGSCGGRQCLRHTDCPLTALCYQGRCVARPTGTAGAAGSTAEAPTDAGIGGAPSAGGDASLGAAAASGVAGELSAGRAGATGR